MPLSKHLPSLHSAPTTSLQIVILSTSLLVTASSMAGENLFGYVKGAETLPAESWELYTNLTQREDKGEGDYTGYDLELEAEYGITNSLGAKLGLQLQSLDTSGLLIEGYLPEEVNTGLEFTGVEGSLTYNFLSPAKDKIGLSTHIGFDYSWVDKHSGQDKDTYSIDLSLLLQKFALEGQLVWVGNIGMETTFAKRAEIDNLPAGFEWPTDPEMEIELKAGTGVSYRFAPKWSVAAEVLYETEFETEVGQERWSVFAGPSVHYGSQTWWTTLTWLPQLKGGGEQYPTQDDTNLHLIEKTEQELRLKIGFNF